MADNLKPLLKRIDDLSTTVFKLAGDKTKSVKPKDIEKNLNKAPLAELTLDLLLCLRNAKRFLEDQNKQIAETRNALKEQKMKIDEHDTSLEKEASSHTVMDEILTEIKENRKVMTNIQSNLEEKSERIATEATKVSSYAAILQKKNLQTMRKEKNMFRHNLNVLPNVW